MALKKKRVRLAAAQADAEGVHVDCVAEQPVRSRKKRKNTTAEVAEGMHVDCVAEQPVRSRKKRKNSTAEVACAEATERDEAGLIPGSLDATAEPLDEPLSAEADRPKRKKKRKLSRQDEASGANIEESGDQQPAVDAAEPQVTQSHAAADLPADNANVPDQAPRKLKKKKKTSRAATAVETCAKTEASSTAEQTAADKDLMSSFTRQGRRANLTSQAGETEAGPSLTIFVDGVPYTWDVEKIKSLFARCGEVAEVNAPTWQDSGRLRGFAHVTFKDAKAKAEGMKMDGIKVGAKGRYLKIESSKPSEAPTAPSAKAAIGKTRLFVKNLPYTATEGEIRELFSSHGRIVDIRVPTSFGRAKGFAYVEFAKSESLQKAVASSAELQGRRLVLDVDAGKGPRAGFHYREQAFGELVAKKSADGRGRGGGFAGKSKGKGR